MNSYLFAWNPNNWEWTTYKQDIEQIENTGFTSELWSCASYKKISPGDRAFLIRLGVEPKGIIGSGIVTTYAFDSIHWSGTGKLVKKVNIEFDTLLDTTFEPILSLNTLQTKISAYQHWTPEKSGISINNEAALELEEIWFKLASKKFFTEKQHEETRSHKKYHEGSTFDVKMTKYERNPYARLECLAYYGFSCTVCDFNFEKQFGEIGKEFIHVHHLKKISASSKQHEVDPIKDLRPVCPNCHAMLHRKKSGFSIDEIKEKLIQQHITKD